MHYKCPEGTTKDAHVHTDIRADSHDAKVTIGLSFLPYIGEIVGDLDEPHTFGGIGNVQLSRRLLALALLCWSTSGGHTSKVIFYLKRTVRRPFTKKHMIVQSPS